MSPAPAMPRTTVQKITGPISIFTSAMNPSPSGFSFTAACGLKYPKVPPAMIARTTQKYRCRLRFLMLPANPTVIDRRALRGYRAASRSGSAQAESGDNRRHAAETRGKPPGPPGGGVSIDYVLDDKVPLID